MSLDLYEILALSAAVVAILMLGTTHLRVNLWFYGIHTVIVAMEAWLIGTFSTHHAEMFMPQFFAPLNISLQAHAVQAVCFGLFKGIAVPVFLMRIIKHIQVESDSGTLLPTALTMHLSVLLLGVSYLLAAQLPGLGVEGDSRIGATAGMSLLFTGILLMLTRRLAISQIIGFLVMENGIYLFALTQTYGMPMIVEMGILLDVLVGVMITGLLLFGIKKSFEHIDVTQLTDLRD
jgi:hydrogenase-4 component E